MLGTLHNVYTTYLAICLLCSRRIDFGDVSEEELKRLSEISEIATFGRNQEHVLDEQYRKSRKLNVAQFNPILDVNALRLSEILHRELLPDKQHDKDIRIERYKLNVYGKTHQRLAYVVVLV